jgi:hypothetical protein
MIGRWHQIPVTIDPTSFHFRRNTVPIAINVGGEFRTRRAVAG